MTDERKAAAIARMRQLTSIPQALLDQCTAAQLEGWVDSIETERADFAARGFVDMSAAQPAP